MKRTVLVSALTAIGLCTQSITADGGGYESRTRLHTSPLTVIINQGSSPIHLVNGYTPVDKLTLFNCPNNAGCLVTAKVFLNLNSNGTTASVSVYVDGNVIEPQGSPTALSALLDQASTKTSLGSHSIQTMIYDQKGGGSTLNAWEIEYTIYALPR